MRFYIMTHPTQNKKLVVHLKIEMSNGALGHVLLDGRFKGSGHLVLMERMLTQLIGIKERKS